VPDYTLVKAIHVVSVVLSGAGFVLRGAWMLRGSPLLHRRLTRILPHLVDTVLLASALTLMVVSRQYPTNHPWVAAKIVALVAYVVLGSLALKRGRTARTRRLALAGALALFAYIVAVALTRHPLPWLSA
jgi:uncharacterized membrane protein SirB2